jgi:toxin ParE1/3/4
MKHIRVAPLARLDLDRAYDRIAMERPDAARRWLVRTDQQFVQLARNPEIGESQEHIKPRLRRISQGNYIIYYLPRGSDLIIARVLHGARDIQDLL